MDLDEEIEALHQALEEDISRRRRGQSCLTTDEHFKLWDKMWEKERERKTKVGS